MKVISEELGHSSERVTSEVYVHTMAEHRAEAATAIGKRCGARKRLLRCCWLSAVPHRIGLSHP
jgi:hypothetical protein